MLSSLPLECTGANGPSPRGEKVPAGRMRGWEATRITTPHPDPLPAGARANISSRPPPRPLWNSFCSRFLLEEAADDDPKLAQQVGKLQLFIGAQDSWWLLRTRDQCCLRIGIENHHVLDPRSEILGDLDQYVGPAVPRRSDIDNQLRNFRYVVRGKGALRQACITVEDHVGSSNSVRFAFGDHT